MHTCMHVCMYVCMYDYVCMYVCMYVWMDLSMYVCVYGWMDGWIYGFMYVCMYGCMYVCLYVRTYVHTYVRIYLSIRVDVCLFKCIHTWVDLSVCSYVRADSPYTRCTYLSDCFHLKGFAAYQQDRIRVQVLQDGGNGLQVRMEVCSVHLIDLYQRVHPFHVHWVSPHHFF